MSRRKCFQRIDNVEKSVRELLTEMKDISEVIVDLAYAAIIFDSREIAEEVEDLECQINTLNYGIRIKAMMAARTMDDAIKLSGLLQVASAAGVMSNAAGDIVKLLNVDVGERPFFSTMLREAEEKIRMTHLSERSDMVNRVIGDLGVESETGMRIIAIKRMKRWIYDPDRDVKLKAKDLLIVRGTEDGYERLRSYAAAEHPWPEDDD